MINVSFERNGEKNCTLVRARFATDLPIERNNLLFDFQCSDQYAAALLEKYLNEQINKTIETAHKNGYEQGWKAAKKHKAKATDFAVFFGKPDDQIAW